jgi:hypothetical protein
MLFYTDITPPRDDRLRTGLAHAVQQAATGEILFYQHDLRMADSGAFEAALGAAAAKRLMKDRVIKLTPDLTLHLETERTRSAFQSGPIFAPFVSLTLLDTLKTDYRATDVIWSPWGDPEFQDFLAQNANAVQI